MSERESSRELQRSPRGIAEHFALADICDILAFVPELHDAFSLARERSPSRTSSGILLDSKESTCSNLECDRAQVLVSRETNRVALAADQDLRLAVSQTLAPD